MTNFQIEYLRKLSEPGEVTTLGGNPVELEKNAEVIWAITSANHSNTRRNPIAGYRRLAITEAASTGLPLKSQSYLIPNTNPKDNFAHYLIEEIHIQSQGRLSLSPENCVVLCSTPDVIKQYEALGFEIVPAELTNVESGETSHRRPWDIVEEIIKSGPEWRSNPIVRQELHPSTLDHYERYGLGDLVVEIHSDPLQSHDDGDLTLTRDYETYRAAFEQNAHRKVQEIGQYVQPGRILDIGCATGETIKLLSNKPELFESDFYGVEVARPLYEICEQRKANGEFGNANVFFYQRNIMQSAIFPDGSVNTSITMALTHEIESYLGRPALLDFMKRTYSMLAPGGVYINYDVAGPNRKDERVYARLNNSDGENPENVLKELPPEGVADFLNSLSSRSRFLRFAHDFRREEGDRISFQTELINGEEYFALRYGDLCDYLAKKDYTINWQSEMHERFTFWNYDDWVRELESAGFEIVPGSKPIQNPWLIKHRFALAGEVFTKSANGELVPIPQPETNVLLIARKPE